MTEPVCHLFRSEDGVEVAVVVVVQSYSRTVVQLEGDDCDEE